MTVARAGALVGAVAAVLASCGGGAQALSPEQFRGQANAICERYDQDLEAIGSPETEAELRAYLDNALPIFRREIDELDELAPPEGDAEAYDTMVDELQTVAASLEDLGAALEDKPVDDSAVAAAFDRTNAAGNRADDKAHQLGLYQCAEDEGGE